MPNCIFLLYAYVILSQNVRAIRYSGRKRIRSHLYSGLNDKIIIIRSTRPKTLLIEN